MGKKNKVNRVYLPRSTMDMGDVVSVEFLASEENISFGKALKLLLIESNRFNNIQDILRKDAPWLFEEESNGK